MRYDPIVGVRAVVGLALLLVACGEAPEPDFEPIAVAQPLPAPSAPVLVTITTTDVMVGGASIEHVVGGRIDRPHFDFTATSRAGVLVDARVSTQVVAFVLRGLAERSIYDVELDAVRGDALVAVPFRLPAQHAATDGAATSDVPLILHVHPDLAWLSAPPADIDETLPTPVAGAELTPIADALAHRSLRDLRVFVRSDIPAQRLATALATVAGCNGTTPIPIQLGFADNLPAGLDVPPAPHPITARPRITLASRSMMTTDPVPIIYRDHADVLRRCFAEHQPCGGSATLQFVVDADGQVSSPRVTAGASASCLERELASWRLSPAPQVDQQLELSAEPTVACH